MPNRSSRRDTFLNFLGNIPNNSPRRKRNGVYSSVTFGKGDRNVKVIFLDTRWNRDHYFIPSLAASRVPLGSVISCVTRLLTAFLLPNIF